MSRSKRGTVQIPKPADYYLYSLSKGSRDHYVEAPDGPGKPLERALCGAPGADESSLVAHSGWGAPSGTRCARCRRIWERRAQRYGTPRAGLAEAAADRRRYCWRCRRWIFTLPVSAGAALKASGIVDRRPWRSVGCFYHCAECAPGEESKP